MSAARKYRYDYIAENGHPSACNIYILQFGNTRYIGFEDINEGAAITNSVELLATCVVRQNDWDPKECLFFEWYLFDDEDIEELEDISSVDEIEYKWDEDKTATHPRWKPFCDLSDNPFKK